METLVKATVEKLSEFQGYILWSLIFAFLHTLFSPRNRSIYAYFIAASTCIPVGVLTGMIASEHGYSEGITYAIVSVAALLAQDIVKFILSVSGFVSDRKDSIIENSYLYLSVKVKTYIDGRLSKADRTSNGEGNSTEKH